MWGDYLDRIGILVDSNSVVDATLWRGRAKVKRILENRYVYWRYWKHRHNPAEELDWENRFDKDRETAKQAINERQTKDVLPKLFGRLYTLRNQLLHGGATWASTVNRAQVETGARIMASLVPHFIDLMIKHPDHGWGAPRFPVVRENAPLSGATGTG